MSLTYDQFVTDLANMLVVPADNAEYLIALPNIIDDMEQFLYRELDLLNTVLRDSSATVSPGTRTFNLPSSNGTFVVVEEFNVITPPGTTDPESGTRNPLLPVSKEVLDYLYPSSTASTIPQYFAPITQNTFIVGPWPDQSYTVEVVGTYRPAPLSSSNQTTLLSVYFPDLTMAGALVFGAGYLKNFGAMADNPQMALSWKTHLSDLMVSAQTEENRKKFVSQGWSSKQPAPLATPPRT